jgi:hypothetical protein
MRKRVKKADKEDISCEFIYLTVNMLNIKRKWSKQKKPMDFNHRLYKYWVQFKQTLRE